MRKTLTLNGSVNCSQKMINIRKRPRISGGRTATSSRLYGALTFGVIEAPQIPSPYPHHNSILRSHGGLVLLALCKQARSCVLEQSVVNVFGAVANVELPLPSIKLINQSAWTDQYHRSYLLSPFPLPQYSPELRRWVVRLTVAATESPWLSWWS